MTTMSTATDNEFHCQSPEDGAEQVRTHPETGLTTGEAARRLAEHGPHALPEKPPTPFWRRVIDLLRGFVVLPLIAAAVVTFAPGDPAQAAAIRGSAWP